MTRTLTIIVPVYNEGPNIELIYDRVRALFAGELVRYQLELIYSKQREFG